jgi:hypothetical protein
MLPQPSLIINSVRVKQLGVQFPHQAYGNAHSQGDLEAIPYLVFFVFYALQLTILTQRQGCDELLFAYCS